MPDQSTDADFTVNDLTGYRRGRVWWVRGPLADGGYVRRSLGTSDRSIAQAKVKSIDNKARKRAVLGDDAPKPQDELTLAQAVLLYTAKPAEAGFLIPIVRKYGDRLVASITPRQVREWGAELYPDNATDTWQRQVVTPVRAVINNAHDRGLAAPILIKAYTQAERVAQDDKRGKASRQAKTPGDWPWLLAFQAAANPYLAALAQFMFETGARIGQSCDIRPDDRDLQNNRIWLPSAKGHPAQWVAISVDLTVRLANLPPRRGKVFGYASRNAVYNGWKSACTRAQIDCRLPHAAGRHGFGTELIVRQGLDAVTVAKGGRWSNPVVPLKTYAHADDDQAQIQAAFRTGRVQAETTDTGKRLKKRRKH